MNNQEVFLLYTMLNMQNSQLPCFIPSISLKPFPHLAHSICHLSLSPIYSQLPLFILLLYCASCVLFLPSPSSSALCCFSKYFSSLSSYLIYIHLSFATLFFSLYPSISPSEPSLLLLLPLSNSLQCKSSTCDTLLPVSSHLNEMCGPAISDSSRQEVRANLSPTSTPHQLLLFVFITQICCP